MQETLRTKSSNNRIVISLMILGLCVFLLSGCQRGNYPANGNSANSNSANNNTTVSSNANSSTPTNANTTALSSDSSKQEPKANTNVANKQTDSADKEKGDCTVKADNTDFFIEETEKTVKLKKGTSLQYIMFGNQGLAVVKAQIDGKWVRGEIKDDLVDCPDDGKTETEKK